VRLRELSNDDNGVSDNARGTRKRRFDYGHFSNMCAGATGRDRSTIDNNTYGTSKHKVHVVANRFLLKQRGTLLQFRKRRTLRDR
jgi:hypothetical protein